MALARGDEVVVVDRVADAERGRRALARREHRRLRHAADALEAASGHSHGQRFPSRPRPGALTHNNNVVGSYNACSRDRSGHPPHLPGVERQRYRFPTAARRTCSTAVDEQHPIRAKSPTACRNGSANSRPMPSRGDTRTCRYRASIPLGRESRDIRSTAMRECPRKRRQHLGGTRCSTQRRVRHSSSRRAA